MPLATSRAPNWMVVREYPSIVDLKGELQNVVNRMKGIHFVVNETGEKHAVLIDLKNNRELWEDFYDTLLTREREGEPRESLAEVKEKLFGKS